jgi:predicted ArsR family transcriptional regulator
MAGILKTDIEKLRTLRSKDMGVTAMAKELGVSKGTVSKQLKKLNLAVATEVIRPQVAKKFVKKGDAATQHLLFLADKAKNEIDWIEKTVPPKDTKTYQEWQDQKLKFCSELRKLISAMADVGYKLFHTEEVKEIIEMILQEVGNESPDCQKRIYERIERRRAIRFPSFLNG